MLNMLLVKESDNLGGRRPRRQLPFNQLFHLSHALALSSTRSTE
jgi:hypothetical protein